MERCSKSQLQLCSFILYNLVTIKQLYIRHFCSYRRDIRREHYRALGVIKSVDKSLVMILI